LLDVRSCNAACGEPGNHGRQCCPAILPGLLIGPGFIAHQPLNHADLPVGKGVCASVRVSRIAGHRTAWCTTLGTMLHRCTTTYPHGSNLFHTVMPGIRTLDSPKRGHLLPQQCIDPLLVSLVSHCCSPSLRERLSASVHVCLAEIRCPLSASHTPSLPSSFRWGLQGCGAHS
jgi:hypothetical protein